MTSITDFQFSDLLEPISAENPAGENLREDRSIHSIYYQIKDARSAARNSERRLDYLDADAPPPQPFWRKVLQLAPQALAERSKDLEIAAYLIEALIRQQGFAGLRDGFRLVRELAERYWDDIYPLPDEDGLITRVAYLAGLNGINAEGTLIRPIIMTPLTANDGYSHTDYMQAQQISKLEVAEQTRRLEDNAVSMEMFERAVHATPTEFFEQRLQDIESCLDEFEQMSAALEDKCGTDLLHTSGIRNALKTCFETVSSIRNSRIALATAEEDLAETAPIPGQAAPFSRAFKRSGNSSTNAIQPGNYSGMIQNRQEALAALAEVAEFFRQTEPHSPLSYAADQIVRWGQMPLPQLMSELIPDANSRQHFFNLVGIDPGEE